MGLRDLKIPQFKFDKMKINIMEELQKIDFEKIKSKNPIKKRETPYEDSTHYETVKEFFLESVEKYPDEDCILEKPDHKTPYKITTYKEFKEDVFGLGTGLINILNLKDKKVIIIGETQYGWYVSYMAMLCGVGIAVPTDRELPDNELENIIKRAKASAIIYSPKKAEAIEKIRESVPEIEYFIEMKSDKSLKGKDVGLDALIELGKNIVKSGDKSFERIEINPDEFKILFFTSGTTSNAKGVMLSNRNLAENINGITAYVKIYPTDMLFSVLPLHHCYESTIGFLYPVSQGASVAICEGLRYIVPNLQEAHPTAILTVPLLVENLYKKINEKIVKSKKDKMVNSMISVTNLIKSTGIGTDIKRKIFKEILDNLGGKLRIIVSAAAPIDRKVGEWVEGIGISFIQGYGLTETAPISAVTPEYKTMVGSAGRVIVQAEAKVDNPNEDGEGEILIKTPTLMLGYYEDEEETKKAIDSDGFFHTGDIGYIDDDNFIFITGRSKNVIVTQNGKNIYPEEIEMMIDKIEEVKEVMVYGKKPENDSKKEDKELIITALVIPDYDKIKELHGDISSDEIYKIIWNQIKDVNKQLTSYKAVKSLEFKEGEFEKTSTMKIKRYKELNKK